MAGLAARLSHECNILHRGWLALWRGSGRTICGGMLRALAAAIAGLGMAAMPLAVAMVAATKRAFTRVLLSAATITVLLVLMRRGMRHMLRLAGAAVLSRDRHADQLFDVPQIGRLLVITK
jgi:hypothetical protein